MLPVLLNPLQPPPLNLRWRMYSTGRMVEGDPAIGVVVVGEVGDGTIR